MFGLFTLWHTVKIGLSLWSSVAQLTLTVQHAAITPLMGLSENGSNVRSGRLIKSGFNKYLEQDQNYV